MIRGVSWPASGCADWARPRPISRDPTGSQVPLGKEGAGRRSSPPLRRQQVPGTSTLHGGRFSSCAPARSCRSTRYLLPLADPLPNLLAAAGYLAEVPAALELIEPAVR